MRHLVLGGGSIGSRHLQNLKQLGYSDLFCLKRKKDAAFQEQFSSTVITTTEEAIEINPDTIIICTPTHLHMEGVNLAVECGAHIFMEKPLTHRRDQLRTIRSLINREKVFFIGFMLRYHPAIKKIKALVSNCVIGEVFYAELQFGSFLPAWHPEEEYRDSYAANLDMGGGVLNTISHEIDLVQLLFGSPETLVTLNRNLGRLGINAEELSDSMLAYPDKTISVHLDFLQKEYSRYIRIYGDMGTISWDWNNGSVVLAKEGCDVETIDAPVELNQLYIDEMADFIEIIKGGAIPDKLGLDHAITNAQLLAAMHTSGSTKSIMEKTEWEQW